MDNLYMDYTAVEGGYTAPIKKGEMIATVAIKYRNSYVAEAEIYAQFNQISGDRTAIYISHRLSSCRFCDEILVFDKGEIVQKGSHETLVTLENGKDHELWHAQAQYYAEQ